MRFANKYFVLAKADKPPFMTIATRLVCVDSHQPDAAANAEAAQTLAAGRLVAFPTETAVSYTPPTLPPNDPV